MKRVIKSYHLILDFFGIILLDEKTGELGRHEKNFESRFYFLSKSSHNYLRITRILKFFAILNLEDFIYQFLHYFAIEVFQHKYLLETMESLVCYWIPTLIRESSLQKIEDEVIKMTGTKLNRELYKYDSPSWANVKIQDMELRDFDLIDKPVFKFPENVTKNSQFFYDKKYIPYKEFNTVSEKLPDEETEMGSLF